MEIFITHIDTACILLELNGFKILTDPVFDEPGRYYHHGFGAVSRKLNRPMLQEKDLEDVDLILLSHHQHKDNLDDRGEAFLRRFPHVVSTPSAARRFSNVKGLKPFQSMNFANDKIPSLRITATPARHHPAWLPEFLSGEVTGFFIECDELQSEGGIYISGDTTLFRGLREVGQRFKIHTGIFHLGCVQFPYLSGLGQYTMSSKDLIKALSFLKPKHVIPIHMKGWSHFRESERHSLEILKREATGLTLLESGVRKHME